MYWLKTKGSGEGHHRGVRWSTLAVIATFPPFCRARALYGLNAATIRNNPPKPHNPSTKNDR